MEETFLADKISFFETKKYIIYSISHFFKLGVNLSNFFTRLHIISNHMFLSLAIEC